MNREQTDRLAERLLKEEEGLGRVLTAQEAEERLPGEFSKAQRERIFKRYRYLSGKLLRD